jgi:hypothetical protein
MSDGGRLTPAPPSLSISTVCTREEEDTLSPFRSSIERGFFG